MSGLVFSLILSAALISALDGILTTKLGFETAEGRAWHGRVREGRRIVEVFVKILGRELQFLLPDSSVPRDVCEKVVRELSAKIYSLAEGAAFQPDYVKVVGPTPSFCYYCLQSVYMPFRCHRCGGFFCTRHRLPERHNCTGDAEGELRQPASEARRGEGSEKRGKTIILKRVPCG